MGETTAVAHGGDPQDRAASPRPRCIALRQEAKGKRQKAKGKRQKQCSAKTLGIAESSDEYEWGGQDAHPKIY